MGEQILEKTLEESGLRKIKITFYKKDLNLLLVKLLYQML